MTAIARPSAERSLLRRAIQADAAIVAVSAALLMADAEMLGPLLGIPATYLFTVGLLFVPYAVFLAYAGTRLQISRRMGWALLIVNALWVVASAVLLISGALPLTAAGFWFIVAQAVAVDLVAVVQYLGLRRKE